MVHAVCTTCSTRHANCTHSAYFPLFWRAAVLSLKSEQSVIMVMTSLAIMYWLWLTRDHERCGSGGEEPRLEGSHCRPAQHAHDIRLLQDDRNHERRNHTYVHISKTTATVNWSSYQHLTRLLSLQTIISHGIFSYVCKASFKKISPGLYLQFYIHQKVITPSVILLLMFSRILVFYIKHKRDKHTQ